MPQFNYASYPSLNTMPVFISGGATGTGASMVRHFAEQGAKTGFVDIADDEGEKLAAELAQAGSTVKFIRCDVTDIDAYQEAIGELERAHGPTLALVNNAAHDQRHDWR